MSSDIRFETPENVQISYQLAGLGTRFVAYVTDTLILIILALVLFFGVFITGASVDIVGRGSSISPQYAVFYFLALFWLAYSLGNLLYFGACELLLRGQTIGKRSMSIRVVKADGFSLDPMAIFLRTIFRVVDHLPPLYLVPLLTGKSQRLGDLVAGTIVVNDEKAELGTLREELTGQKIVDSQFRFDVTSLGRARPQDIQAVEKLMERWSNIPEENRWELLHRIVPPLAARMQVDCPIAADWYACLRDLLAAEYRRQHRKLG